MNKNVACLTTKPGPERLNIRMKIIGYNLHYDSRPCTSRTLPLGPTKLLHSKGIFVLFDPFSVFTVFLLYVIINVYHPS